MKTKSILKLSAIFALSVAAFAQSSEQQYLQADAELNAVYKELRALLDPANQKKLKDWQMKWVNKNAIAIKKASGPADKAKLLLEPTQTRLVELEALLAEIKDYAERDLDFEDANGHIRYLGAKDSDALLSRDFPEDSLRLTCGITLAPGIHYKGRDIRGMTPELAYLLTDTNKKLLVCNLTEPAGDMPMLEGFTWSFPYYLSPDGSYAIVESLEDQAFHSDGAEGKTLYYVYRLPALADVPRNAPRGSAPKKIVLKPIKALNKAQLAEAHPEAAVPAGQEARGAVTEANLKTASELPQSPKSETSTEGKITGFYTNLGESEESGDMAGIELFVFQSGRGAYVLYMLAEGEARRPVLLDAVIENNKVKFQVDDTSYTGTLKGNGLELANQFGKEMLQKGSYFKNN